MSVEVIRHESDALRDNPLGDPHVRDLHVIVPDDLEPNEAVPCVWWLSGYSGVSRSMLSHSPWEEGLAERVARLRAEGKIGKMIIALPDAFTKWGGSQYLGSTAHGDYATYLLDELRTAVESRWSICGHGIAGKSSGGFGAIVHAMRRPELFGAVACHSGDMGFELAYTGELPILMTAIHDAGSLEAFVSKFDAATKKKSGRWIGPLSVLAMAAAYSPDPSRPLGVALPFDLETGAIDREVFARWLAHDPVQMIDEAACQSSLQAMKLVFVDCGSKDEYHLQWGARGFAKKLCDLGIAHEFEEFPDGHRGTGYRLDVSLPKLYAALAP